jgi:hypothetical protein
MAEMERIKADEKTYKAFATLKATTNNALKKAYKSVKEVDGEEDEEEEMDMS